MYYQLTDSFDGTELGIVKVTNVGESPNFEEEVKVPVEEVRKRIRIKQIRIEKESKQLEIMKQIMGGK